MSLRFLLDSNVLSEPPRRTPNAHVMQRLRAHVGEIAIATVVWHEMVYGMFRLPESPKRAQLTDYLYRTVRMTVAILDYNEDAAHWHAAERARLEALGKSTSFADGQIAAIAHVHGLTLVTRNLADFASFEGLQMETWHEIPA
ncbi:MAG: type II toxin-antitoxin system VapC family toxin [Armatimonadetes bacterium]|nr:type II toxin-antitoxin system VapC family toxin [Armatimonadota bacterium]